jgi:GntR family transcriptional regulator/MocR family aminotransferase
MFPSLRLGFYVAPRSLVATFQRISGAFLHGVPSSLQATLASFMAEGHFATHLRRMREIYRERHEVFQEEAAKRLDGVLTFSPIASGFHVVGRFLDERHDEREVQAAAEDAGLSVSPLGRFCIAPIPERGLVLGVSAIEPKAIRSGVAARAAVMERS